MSAVGQTRVYRIERHTVTDGRHAHGIQRQILERVGERHGRIHRSLATLVVRHRHGVAAAVRHTRQGSRRNPIRLAGEVIVVTTIYHLRGTAGRRDGSRTVVARTRLRRGGENLSGQLSRNDNIDRRLAPITARIRNPDGHRNRLLAIVQSNNATTCLTDGQVINIGTIIVHQMVVFQISAKVGITVLTVAAIDIEHSIKFFRDIGQHRCDAVVDDKHLGAGFRLVACQILDGVSTSDGRMMTIVIIHHLRFQSKGIRSNSIFARTILLVVRHNAARRHKFVVRGVCRRHIRHTSIMMINSRTRDNRREVGSKNNIDVSCNTSQSTNTFRFSSSISQLIFKNRIVNSIGA